MYIVGVDQFDGWRIREARRLLGMSRNTLARAIKVTRPTIWSWEQGRTYPDADDLAALAAAVGKPVEWFFGTALAEAPMYRKPDAED